MDSTLLALLRNPETPLWLIREACMDADLRSVWAVQYYGGEYSDRFDKHIGVFLDRLQAEQWMEKVQAEYTEKRLWYSGLEYSSNSQEAHLYEALQEHYWTTDEHKRQAHLDSCDLVCYTTYAQYHFRIIEIPLRVE